jgi:hypothetical protein
MIKRLELIKNTYNEELKKRINETENYIKKVEELINSINIIDLKD